MRFMLTRVTTALVLVAFGFGLGFGSGLRATPALAGGGGIGNLTPVSDPKIAKMQQQLDHLQQFVGGTTPSSGGFMSMTDRTSLLKIAVLSMRACINQSQKPCDLGSFPGSFQW